MWEPGLAKVNSGHTNWKRAVRSQGWGEYNLGVYYKLSGEGVGDHKDNSNTRCNERLWRAYNLTLLIILVPTISPHHKSNSASPDWQWASGAPSGSSWSKRERQRLILFIYLLPLRLASKASASHSSVAQDRPSPLRFLWWRFRRLLIAWLIHSTCEGQSETPGRGGVPCENLWGSTAHRTPCLWLPPVWPYSAMWGTAHRLGHHNCCKNTQMRQ